LFRQTPAQQILRSLDAAVACPIRPMTLFFLDIPARSFRVFEDDDIIEHARLADIFAI
jgi:hypothetical protein